MSLSCPNNGGMRPYHYLYALLCVGVAGGCAPASSKTVDTSRRPRPVRLAPVRAAAQVETAVFPARVRAERQPALSFRIPGRVVTVAVDVGDEVEQGQLVALLDPNDFRTRVADAEAAVAQVQADAARTRRVAERAKRLFAAKAVSEAERDQTRDIAKSSAARLQSAVQRLALATRELEYTRLVSPERGVVVERLFDPGANVRAGQPIVRVSGDALEIRTDVPESALVNAKVGAQALVRLPSLGDTPVAGQVVRVTKGATDRSVLYPVFIRLTDPNLKLVPGLAAEVRFTAGPPGRLSERDPLLAVPPAAVGGDPDGAFVWVLEPAPAESADGGGGDEVFVARRRGIRLVRITDRAALVSDGLRVGEKVATAGASYLFEGQRVRLARLAPSVFEGLHASPGGSGAVEVEPR